MQQRAGTEGLQAGVQRERRAPLNGDLKRKISAIGLGELSTESLGKRHGKVLRQLRTGLARAGEPTTTDGGILAIKTGITPITAELWSAVPTGKEALVEEFGGTNLKVRVAEKQRDGSVALSEPVHEESIPLEARQVPFDALIDRIADPLIEQQAKLGIEDFGISLGLMHTGEVTKDGIEAHLITDTGVLDKGVAITNWGEIPAEERKIVQAVRRKMGGKGRGAALNDTVGVALDGGALLDATTAGFDVLPAGIVAGTGTNGAVDMGDGIINTEIGHAQWVDDAVSQRMRQRLIERGILSPEKDSPELEYETGQYLPLRLAAGIEILAKSGDINVGNAHALTKIIEQRAHPDENPALISDLATGNERLTPDAETNALVEALAQSVMRRAEQVYGSFIAAIAAPTPERTTDQPVVLLTEGSTLLKGMSNPDAELRTGAEVEADLLGQSVMVFPASGMAGVASVALSLGEERAAA